jgi:mannosyltransferase
VLDLESGRPEGIDLRVNIADVHGWFWPALIAIMVLATALRVTAINYHSFWYDEAITDALTKHSYADLYFGRARDNGNPPLFWLLAKAWTDIFGRSESAHRSLPMLLSAFAVPLLAVLGRVVLDARTGMLAALLLAVSPISIELANEARVYALVQFLAIASTLLFLSWLRSHKPASLILYGLLVAAICYSHYFGPAVPLAHALACLASKEHRDRLMGWFGAVLLAAVCYIPWFPVFISQAMSRGTVIGRVDAWLTQFVVTPIVFSLGRTFAWRDSNPAVLVVALLIGVVGFFVPVAVAMWKLRRRRSVDVLLTSWWLVPILGPLSLAWLGTSIYYVRYAVIGLPAFVLLAAHGMLLMRASFRVPLLITIAASTGASLFNYNTIPLKDDWRTIERVIANNWRAGEPVLFDSDIEVTSFLYYARRNNRVPPQMLGITNPPDVEHQMRGLLYEHGRRVDPTPRAHEALIGGANGLWLLMCVPNGTREQYVRYFSERGFSLRQQIQLRPRATVLQFRAVKDSDRSISECIDSSPREVGTLNT